MNLGSYTTPKPIFWILKFGNLGYVDETDTSLYVYNSIIYIGVGFTGIKPMLSYTSKGLYFPKACPLGFYPILRAILNNRPFKGFEQSIPLVRLKFLLMFYKQKMLSRLH
jgi:hypothetical protein